ncbi:polysaccharide biosynthesis C-terminal domain-containing protein [Candidatus Woesearchaeota archaeon]|nr:polysaccharide biosynthesis C-terminal domain-containing protein [Candidatus Woesearchaeota archaeon]
MEKENYGIIARQMGVSYLFTILSFIFGPVLIILLTRNLSVAEYGVYSILAATIAVLSVFLNLALNAFIINKLPGENYYTRVKSMASILFFELIFLITLVIVLFIPKIKNYLLSFLKLQNYSFEFQLVLIIIFISIICYILLYYLAANKKIELQSFLSFSYNRLWVVLLLIFLLIFKRLDLKIVFSLWLSGLIISFITILFSLKKDIIFFFKKVKSISSKTIKNALIFSSPLIPASACGWVIVFADRYMINYLKNSALTGIYSLSYSLVTLILSFSMIISNVLHPYISKAWSDKKGHQILFNAMLKYNIIIIFPASIGLFILRKQIITLISGTDYLLGSTAMAILILFPFFSFLTDLYSKNLALRDKTKLIASIYICGALLNIILNYFLIIKYGINGAAISTIISYLLVFLSFHLATKKQFSWDYRFLKIKRIALSSILMGTVVYLVNPQIYATKILTIVLGVIIYAVLLFALGVFVKDEYTIMKGFLPKIRKI